MNATDIEKVTLHIEKAIGELMKPEAKEKFWVAHYGANNIHPKHLVYWICVQTDSEKQRFESNASFRKRLRDLLTEYNYPEEGIPGVFIGFESQETVDRESGGNWWCHWK